MSNAFPADAPPTKVVRPSQLSEGEQVGILEAVLLDSFLRVMLDARVRAVCSCIRFFRMRLNQSNLVFILNVCYHSSPEEPLCHSLAAELGLEVQRRLKGLDYQAYLVEGAEENYLVDRLEEGSGSSEEIRLEEGMAFQQAG